MSKKIFDIEDLYFLLKDVLSYRTPQVCKHAIGCNILTLIERKGIDLNKELVASVVEADDDKAFEILDNLINIKKNKRRLK